MNRPLLCKALDISTYNLTNLGFPAGCKKKKKKKKNVNKKIKITELK